MVMDNKETNNQHLKQKPITNQLLWDISKLIVSRINTAKGETLGTFEINTLESDWFNYLEETLIIEDSEPVAPIDKTLSTSEYVEKWNISRMSTVEMVESYALLREQRAVESERKRITEDVMITLSEVLYHSHIFESEYQNLRKKLLEILNNGK